jgi:hypothetical protein
VEHLTTYLGELRVRAEEVAASISPISRGYFSPSEDDEIQALLISYYQTRRALLDLIHECLDESKTADTDEYDDVFLPAFAGAAVLVDAARFLREATETKPHLRRKLNQEIAAWGIPGGTYDTVQKSLFQSFNIWRLYRAMNYFDNHRDRLLDVAKARGMESLFEIAQRLRPRLDVPVDRFLRAKLRTRTDQWIRTAARTLIMQVVYDMRKFVSSMMSDKYVRAGHRPQLPEQIVTQIVKHIRPGDILVVRKDFALTNYFLPGYWPHAALYLGHPRDLAALQLHEVPDVKRRWRQMESEEEIPRVLESMKDGVRIRSWQSPLASDSVLVLRPQLPMDWLAKGLARVFAHEGKPYDFDFDFRRSDRLVCTEVIYRAFDGLHDVRFPLVNRVGRPTLSGGDLVQMARKSLHVAPVCCYAPRFFPDLVLDDQVRHVIEKAADGPV